MMECKTCDVEMQKVYSFDQDNNQTWYFKCPMCGFKTRPNPLTFDDNGRVVTRKQNKKPNDKDKPNGNKSVNKSGNNKTDRKKKSFNKERKNGTKAKRR